MKQKLYIVDPLKHIIGAFKAASNEAKSLKDICDNTFLLHTILSVVKSLYCRPIKTITNSLKRS